jgi:hypothetical protein
MQAGEESQVRALWGTRCAELPDAGGDQVAALQPSLVAGQDDGTDCIPVADGRGDAVAIWW